MENNKPKFGLRELVLIIVTIGFVVFLVFFAIFVINFIRPTPTPEVISIQATVASEEESAGITDSLNRLTGFDFDEVVDLISSEDSPNIYVAYSNESGPYSYQGTNNRPMGFEIDLLSEIEERWFNRTGVFVFKAIDASERLDTILSGDYDIVAGAVSETSERCSAALCSSPLHMFDTAAVMIQSDSGIKDFSEIDEFCAFFEGNRVGVVVGTTGVGRLPSVFDNCSSGPSIEEYRTRQDVVNGLVNNNIVGYITDSSILHYYAELNGSEASVVSFEDAVGGVSLERYTFLIAPDDEGLKDLFDLTLAAMVCDGTFDAIVAPYKQYLSDEFGDGITLNQSQCSLIEEQPNKIRQLISN
ncbi:MAG: transporter substrate-binding domain-containing protein [Ardenticatenaceae bacterium]|nr:transporter substrate-binding domain-containing protein [Ardenticatenaceae bacterium]